MTEVNHQRVLKQAQSLMDWLSSKLPQNELRPDTQNDLQILFNQLQAALEHKDTTTLVSVISQMDLLIEHNANNDLMILQNSLPQTQP